jgi:dTDP-4-dehydrorhamnose reductase
VQLDLTDAGCAHRIVAVVMPDVIVHLAAVSSPATCEKDFERCRIVNSPAALINAVTTLVPQCLFVFTSTDLVYDGERPPYSPTHDADKLQLPPVNAYGRLKRECEELVLALPRAVVLRLSNVIGPAFAIAPTGAKFLEWLHRAYKSREYVGLRCDEIRSFVYIDDVVRVICALLKRAGDTAVLGKIVNVGE